MAPGIATIRPMRSAQLTWYEVLELEPTASAAEIEAACKRLRKRWHPDLNPDAVDEATERFKAVQAAWEVLGDPHLRAAYDRDLSVPRDPVDDRPRWWAPETPMTFASTAPGAHSPRGFPTDDMAARAADRMDAAPRPERPAAPRPRPPGARIDGMSVAAALTMTVLGLGAIWWPYALFRHPRSAGYWIVTALVYALLLASGPVPLLAVGYWLASIVPIVVLLVLRGTPDPAPEAVS